MQTSAKIIGVPELVRKLAQISLEGKLKAQQAVERSALKIERDAKNAVPVDTGRLRSSIRVEFSLSRLEANVLTDVNYAPFVEFGTAHAPAQPYLFPAAELARGEFERTVQQTLTDLGGD
jgi:HK97 gp10 family phage protein